MVPTWLWLLLCFGSLVNPPSPSLSLPAPKAQGIVNQRRGVTDASCLPTAGQLKQCWESDRFGATSATAAKTTLTLVACLHRSRWRESQWADRQGAMSQPLTQPQVTQWRWSETREELSKASMRPQASEDLCSTHQSTNTQQSWFSILTLSYLKYVYTPPTCQLRAVLLNSLCVKGALQRSDQRTYIWHYGFQLTRLPVLFDTRGLFNQSGLFCTWM